MYSSSPQQAYDRAITVFSPDGRLFQVEYAKEAVKRGAIALGITNKDGVVLVAYKNIQSKLIVPSSIKKIFQIDENILITASGLIADARRMIDHARLFCQQHRLTYGEGPTAEMVARDLADLMQIYTQYGGIRPFGVSVLVAGFSDHTPELYEVEPSGAMTSYLADSIGAGKRDADKLLEKKYKAKMSVKDAVSLGLSVIKKVSNVELSNDNVEIAHVTKKGISFLSYSKA